MALCAHSCLRHVTDRPAADDQKRNRLSSVHPRFARRGTNAAGGDCGLRYSAQIRYSENRRWHHETGSRSISAARLLRHPVQSRRSRARTLASGAGLRGDSLASVLVCGSYGATRGDHAQAGKIAPGFGRSASYTFAGGTGPSATDLVEHAGRVTRTRHSYVFAG